MVKVRQSQKTTYHFNHGGAPRFPPLWGSVTILERKIKELKKICPTCLETFEITKWQKGKIYCTEMCKPKWQKPSTGNPVGRPKAKK